MTISNEHCPLPEASCSEKFLALFDFDGTITKSDSLYYFLLFSHSPISFFYKSICLAPLLVAHRLKILDAHKAKEKILKKFFDGWSADRFTKVANDFSSSKLDLIVRKEALQRIQNHLAAGHDVVVVSASLESYLKPWCDKYGIQIIGTRADLTSTGFYSGIKGKNCNFEEKVFRIKNSIDLNLYSRVYAYGDSEGDMPMLNLANHKFFKPFR